MFITALLILANIWKQPISGSVDKKVVIHLHNGVVIGGKKEGNVTFCNSMDAPGEYKPSKEKQVPYDFPHMWSLMNKLN